MEHNHGAVSRTQFEEAGLSRWTLNRRIKRGDLRRLARGVVALPGAPDGLMLDLAGGVLALGSACVVGPTAAWLRGYTKRRPEHGHLAVPEGRGRISLEGVDVRRETHFAAIPISVVRGLPVAGVNWTLMDSARDFDDPALAAAIARALAMRDTSLSSLGNAAERRGRWNGSARFRSVVAAMSRSHTHSKEEAFARRLLRDAGLRPHPKPLPLRSGGQIIAEADIPFLEERLDIEVDGPHHYLQEVLRKDRVRDRKVQGIDWHASRFPTYEIRRDPPGFVKEVEEILRMRREVLEQRRQAS